MSKYLRDSFVKNSNASLDNSPYKMFYGKKEESRPFRFNLFIFCFILFSLPVYGTEPDIETVPKHLLIARYAVGMPTSPWHDKPEWFCFSFVNTALALSLPAELLEAFTNFNTEILQSRPAHEQADEMIPYHYSLMAAHLKKHPKDFLRTDDIFNARPGDILVYIDPQYNPDPTSRSISQGSGTHVAFIDAIEPRKQRENLGLRLIDASRFGRGRSLDPARSTHTPCLKKGTIAYNYISISKKEGKHEVWSCKMRGRKVFNKYLYLLRFEY